MTPKTRGKHWRLPASAFACALMIATTAVAEQPAPQNIPEAAPEMAREKSRARVGETLESTSPLPSDSDLPPPYEAWRGKSFGGPPTWQSADVPLPLARPRQVARRPLELSLALATFLPSCGSGSIDDRGCITVGAGSGLDAALLYRVTPFFAAGAELALSGFGGDGHGVLSRSGGNARFYGVTGRVYFADDGAWDPYLALTIGAGTLGLRGSEGARASTSGWGARVAGGVDYALASHLRIGPNASFTHWIAWSEQACSDDICRAEPAVYGRLLGFATLGLRLTGSFGEVM